MLYRWRRFGHEGVAKVGDMEIDFLEICLFFYYFVSLNFLIGLSWDKSAVLGRCDSYSCMYLDIFEGVRARRQGFALDMNRVLRPRKLKLR